MADPTPQGGEGGQQLGGGQGPTGQYGSDLVGVLGEDRFLRGRRPIAGDGHGSPTIVITARTPPPGRVS